MTDEMVPIKGEVIPSGKSWERRPDEPTKWFDRFVIYLRIGTNRSMRAAYRQWRREQSDPGRWKTGTDPVRAPESWMDYAKLWDWQKRAADWDMHLFDEEEDVWMARREKLRELEFELSGNLIKRAKLLLDWPIAEMTQPAKNPDGSVIRDAQGQPIFQHIEPSKWALGDAVRMIVAGTELQRRATGSDAKVGIIIDIPWSELTKEQLRRIAAGENYEQILLEG